MRHLVLGLVLSFVTSVSHTNAATVSMDISDEAGFTFLGASGSSGNGVLSISPKYFFDPGTTVDFGTATIVGDGIDHRSGCGSLPGQSICVANTGTVHAYFLTNGQGGFDGLDITGLCLPVAGTEFCMPTTAHLLFTLGLGNDGVQLVFQGRSLHIDPPAQVPLPASWLLFLSGLGLVQRRMI